MHAARRLKSGLMLTEACRPGCMGDSWDLDSGIANAADNFLQSWATWEWKTFYRENNVSIHSNSQWAAFGTSKNGYGSSWENDMPPNLP